MLTVSPFYGHYTINICASCHNSTSPPIKLNKLSCSNTNMILLKHSCLIGQLNVPNLVSKMYTARVCISTGCPRWAAAHPGILGRPRPRFPSVFRSLLAPSRLPRRRLAVPGRHDSRRRCRTSRRPGAARPTASPLPGRAAVPTFPVCSGLSRATPTKPTRFILRYVLNTQQPLLITHFLIDSLLIRQDCH